MSISYSPVATHCRCSFPVIRKVNPLSRPSNSPSSISNHQLVSHSSSYGALNSNCKPSPKRVNVVSSKSEPLKVMISGAPASGKGIQCELIANKGDDLLEEEHAKTLPGYFVRGLTNHEGTCFLNALLQILFSSNLLRNYFLESVDDSFGPLTSSLRNLFLQTVQTVGPRNRINKDAIDPTPLFRTICATFPNTYAPDKGGYSIALLRDLINGLSSEELSSRLKRGVLSHLPAYLDSMFRIKSKAICSGCGHAEDVTRLDLMLDVPYIPNPNHRWIEGPKTIGKINNYSDLDEHMMTILKLFEWKRITAKSAKTKRNLYITTRCISCHRYANKCLLLGRRRQNTTEIKLLITKAPHILVIDLTYAMFDYDKLLHNGPRVEYRETLDMKPYMDPKCIDRDDAYKYRLIGLVEDTIMKDAGHAFAFVRGTNAEGLWSWYVIDDTTTIRKLDVEQVLARKPAILFYERC